MPRAKGVEVVAINITTHPHSPEKYVELFDDAFKLKHPVGYLGVEKFVLNKPVPISAADPTRGISGHFHKFTEIDLRAPWMNLDKLETVESEDGEPVVEIPEELKPNCKTAPFIFVPRGHRFFFPQKNGQITFSPRLVSNSLMELFSQPSILEKYGEVTITIETREETIDTILEIPSLTKLTVSVSLPNPDDLGGESLRALERMEAQNAKKVVTTWTGTKDSGIKPDDDTKGFMKLSCSNGFVKAEGYGADDVKIEESTMSHPVVFKDTVAQGESVLSRVKTVALQQINRFTNRNA